MQSDVCMESFAAGAEVYACMEETAEDDDQGKKKKIHMKRQRDARQRCCVCKTLSLNVALRDTWLVDHLYSR